jgi:CRISPR-associated protein Cmr6
MDKEKGTLIVTKKGGAKVKRSDGKETNILAKYDYSAYIPTSGKNRIDCEYESNYKKQAVKVYIDGKELSKDTKAEKQELEKIKRQAEREELEIKRKEREKRNKEYRFDSFDIDKVFCPEDTMKLNLLAIDAENFALKLNKFSRWDEKDRKFKTYFSGYKENPKFQIIADFDKINFDQLIQRNVQNAKKLLRDKCKKITMSSKWRLIIGLGGASVYETSMTLHHIYGFPYIPASAVKGVLRNYIISACFDLTTEERNSISEEKWGEEKEKKALNDKNGWFQKIFGTQEEAGKIIFFDTFPTKPPKIEVDVMTPHYGDYYTDNENKKRIAPTDTMSPNPIPFLTVADTPFQFLFGSKDFEINQKLWSFEEGGEAKTLSEWLKSALENHGIGAKTAVGYGYMQ